MGAKGGAKVARYPSGPGRDLPRAPPKIHLPVRSIRKVAFSGGHGTHPARITESPLPPHNQGSPAIPLAPRAEPDLKARNTKPSSKWWPEAKFRQAQPSESDERNKLKKEPRCRNGRLATARARFFIKTKKRAQLPTLISNYIFNRPTKKTSQNVRESTKNAKCARPGPRNMARAIF